MRGFQNTYTLPVLLMNYIQIREQKWYRVGTASLLTSRRIEIARSAWEPKWHGFLAEDALVQSCPERIFWSSDNSGSQSSQSSHRMWPPNGSSRIRAKPWLHRKRKRVHKSSWGRRGNQKSLSTDNSQECGKFSEDLSWNHCTSTPHRSETNGIAERAVRRVKEGTSAVLLQSGLNESWWADSMECYTYLRNVTDLLSDGKTPCERRFGQPFKGPIIPFGSLIEYHTVTAKDQSRIHQFGKKVSPGLFLGYAL